MIEPAYRRDQLWRPARCIMRELVIAGAILGGALALFFAAAAVVPSHLDVFVDDSRHGEASMLVDKLAAVVSAGEDGVFGTADDVTSDLGEDE